MGLGTKDILVGGYLLYWAYNKVLPFSIWWIIGLYIVIFIIESLIASIIKKSSKVIEKKANDIDSKVKGFDNRLSILESIFKSSERRGK